MEGAIMAQTAALPVLSGETGLTRYVEEIFVGITDGGTFAGALRVCTEAPKGATVLCVLPDTGERYLSTPLFADVPVDMNEEEIANFAFTPAAQIGS
jgi:cysteine synthase